MKPGNPANPFDRLVGRGIEGGLDQHDAALAAFEAYLDGGPGARRKKRTKAEQDRLFWSSGLVAGWSPADWGGEPMSLALARYLGQDKVRVEGLMGSIAVHAPEALVLAARRSAIVLDPAAPHWRDIAQAGANAEIVADLIAVLDALAVAHRERVDELRRWKAEFESLGPFDFLLRASLYAFEHLVPRSATGGSQVEAAGGRIDTHWQAINDLLHWKLKTAPPESLALDDGVIAASLQRHLSPLLFAEAQSSPAATGATRAFAALMAAQLELNEFLSRSIDAFCYDDSVRFVRKGDRGLDLLEVDRAAKARWFRDGRKLDLLHGYWLHRALDEFERPGLALQRFGPAENEDDKRWACVKAQRTCLRLEQVYGITGAVSTPNGEQVDLFQAVLSLELMSQFYLRDFLARFAAHAQPAGDWVAGLRALVIEGLRDGMQNRFPLTWSSRADKVRNITAWTATPSQPLGSARMADAILGLWSVDMAPLAARLREGTPGLEPALPERPVLVFGSTLVQLPWVVGLQNNSTAAINNLRRLSSRRGEAREETRRIEGSLAQALSDRGFRVLLNWEPAEPREAAGEIDILAARDGRLLVLEVKSTFLRQSLRDAWRHASTTLRQAGRQLQRKVAAIRAALARDVALREQLALSEVPASQCLDAWIVDTSIECDHQRFGGFLKVSLEEVLIALRDDADLLDTMEQVLAQRLAQSASRDGAAARATLYPEGFSAARFVQVVEAGLVWSGLPEA